jgi:spermidine synthase
MIPLETLGRARTADDRDLVLYHRDGVFQIRIDGLELMSSNAHGSEKALAELAHEAVLEARRPRLLIGGLGMGFTLRAALDCFPRSATLVVAELFAEVVEWNRGPLSHLAGRPLDDPRVQLHRADVNDLLAGEPFDCILLDVDNGPGAFTVKSNARLYGSSGINRMLRALKPGGVLALWSSAVEPAFERQLNKAGLEVQCHRVHARGAGGGARHAIYLVRRRPRSAGAPVRTAADAPVRKRKKSRRRR